jgi:hypothetical protein
MGISYTYSDPSGIMVVGAYARMNQWSSTADEGTGVGQALVLTYVSTADYSAGKTPIRQTPIDFGLDAIVVLPIVEGVRDVVDAVILTMPADFPGAVVIPDPPPVGVPPGANLELVRTRYLSSIEAEKERRIQATGFEYPAASGLVFGLSPSNRTYWLALATTDVRAALTAGGAFPLHIRTGDERDFYDVADAADALAMALTAVSAVEAQRQIAGVVKDAVLIAVDIPAIQVASAAYLAGL